jgi:hypothetical protein
MKRNSYTAKSTESLHPKSLLALAIVAMLVMAAGAFQGILLQSANAETTQFSLKVVTQDSNGSQINGYYTVLSQSDRVVSTGFSPATFTLSAGQADTVSVSDYGAFVFDHWKDTNSKTRDRSITISSDTEVVAVYRNVNEPSPSPSPGGQSTLTIRSEDMAGTQINGYYTTLSQNTDVTTDFTVATFTLNNDQAYTVSISDYGQYIFDHWKDTNSKTRDRSISITSNTELSAIYRNVNDPNPPPPPTGQSSLTVTTYDATNKQINGYYTTVSKDGKAASGFSPAKFTLNNGQTYVVSVSDYGAFVFDHWKDTNSKTRDRSISITSNTELSAIYRNVNDPNPPPPPPPTGSGSITMVSSGFVAADPLNDRNADSSQLKTNNPHNWFYYGSAVAQNAPVTYYQDTTQGLQLGVEAVAAGQWAGFYAETPDTNAQLFHAVLTIPYNSVQDNTFDTGMYVQTNNGLINYVTCAAMATPSGNAWAVVRTTGDYNQATEFQTLWSDSSVGQPQTRDCTIITNGSSMLQVYLDGRLVYSSNSLNLQMPPPFNVYLEVQSSSPTQMLLGTYTDYYAAASSSITINSAPAGGTVKLLQGSSVVATGAAGSDGKASIDLGKYHFPLSVSIQVFGPDGKMTSSTSSSIAIWGGDIYTTAAKSASAVASSAETLQSLSAADSSRHNKSVGMHNLPPSVFK